MNAVRLNSTPQDPWVAVSIEPDSLQSTTNVILILIEEANQERERLAEQFSSQISVGSKRIRNLSNKFLSELSKRAYTVSAGGFDLTIHENSESTSNPETVLAEKIFEMQHPYLRI
ncbi:MAG: hypothetical protein OXE41_04915 [Gammaproteobacteria bacterium]|nr:hypothetical protein [Gammaproteobacteria bacterium]MCY4218787.1 hypothetical protein [Gammaproteobacteria bacterium]MCY4274721.1 hypothetical protein [Gammaproteobacteria bacterium]